MKFLITILLVWLGVKTAISQEYNYHYGATKLTEKESGIYEDEFGKCYERSLLLIPYEEVAVYRNRYFSEGIKTKIVEVGNFEIEIAEQQSGWIKKKADRNCLSADPNDCLVWCRINTPKRVVAIKIIDEEALVDISILNEEYQNLLLDSGYMIYSETNCEIDNAIFHLVLNGLNNYFKEPIEENELNLFMGRFQYENDLPIGGLNLETLYELKVL